MRAKHSRSDKSIPRPFAHAEDCAGAPAGKALSMGAWQLFPWTAARIQDRLPVEVFRSDDIVRAMAE